MTIKELQQEKVREILFKYLLSDSLKPQYDGMSGWELAGIILREIERIEHEEMVKDFERQGREERLQDLAEDIPEDECDCANIPDRMCEKCEKEEFGAKNL